MIPIFISLLLLWAVFMICFDYGERVAFRSKHKGKYIIYLRGNGRYGVAKRGLLFYREYIFLHGKTREESEEQLANHLKQKTKQKNTLETFETKNKY